MLVPCCGQETIDKFFGMAKIFGPVLGTALVAAGIGLHVAAGDVAPIWLTWGSLVPFGVTVSIPYPIICSAPVRRAMMGWLARLGSREEERQAAAVAGLMGELSPSKALAIGKSTFCGLPSGALRQPDLDSNSDTGLNARTVKLALGSCDAFVRDLGLELRSETRSHGPMSWRPACGADVP